MVWALSLGVWGQMVGIVVEVDTTFQGPNTPTPDDPFDPDGLLEGFVAYKVYAEFTNPDDALSAIFSDVPGMSTPPMYIDAPCGCHNPVTSSIAMDATNPSGLWTGPFADFEYDTYWTIGMPSSDAPGFLPQNIGLPEDGSSICSDIIENGSLFTIGVPSNSIAGEDLRVLIGQVTTCGDWCINASFQCFVNGDQLSSQYASFGELCVNSVDYGIYGCTDPEACNFVPEADISSDCIYPEEGFDCDGNCLNDEDQDGICDEEDDCFGENDECGICNGEGIPEGFCDCEGTPVNLCGICENGLSSSTEIIQFDEWLLASQSISYEYFLNMEVSSVTFNLDFYGPGSEWPADMIVVIYSPNGNCLGGEGYNINPPSNCLGIDFPTN